MKATAAALVAALMCQTASAHYIWQTINGGAAYAYFRTNTDYNSPVTDTTSTDMRCNVGASTGGSTGTLSVAAGTKLTLGLDVAVYHQGPVDFYLGKVPSGSTASSWDGSGANWFKFDYRGPTFTGGVATWPMSISYDVTVPAGLPAGQWLLRAEQIGIHNPAGAPQFYIGCAQLQVTGGGSCSPNYFSIPGHITATDPGITVNIYTDFTSYQEPGPAVYSCGSGSGSGSSPTTVRTSTTSSAVRTSTAGQVSTTSRVTTTAAPVSTTSKVSTTVSKTTTANSAGQTLYGQCGGTGWTGPTTCASGTCKVTNQYYSQCS